MFLLLSSLSLFRGLAYVSFSSLALVGEATNRVPSRGVGRRWGGYSAPELASHLPYSYDSHEHRIAACRPLSLILIGFLGLTDFE
jgi:hypothetical protein